MDKKLFCLFLITIFLLSFSIIFAQIPLKGKTILKVTDNQMHDFLNQLRSNPITSKYASILNNL
ncbi:MAG: hypothetical protein NC935_04380, partial [Candidatus Omnitrophica bacterium]|nr:hypothetical protein [Candidatus Omnitrophota bacterium]